MLLPAADQAQLTQFLDEKNRWFVVKKTKAIHVSLKPAGTAVPTTKHPEGEVLPQNSLICKGNGSEVWISTRINLEKEYRPTNVVNGEWQKWLPRHDVPGFWAALIPPKFAKYSGYYIMKNYSDLDALSPWLIERKSFNLTYTKIMDANDISNILQFGLGCQVSPAPAPQITQIAEEIEESMRQDKARTEKELEQELAKREEQKKQEELQKQQERKKHEELKKLEEQKKQEAQKKQEELKKQDEQKKQEELKKQDEQKKQEELKKQDEQKKQEELRKQEEQKKQEELKKQKELIKQEE
eukprot:TRINITY_DN542_c0_g2_i1.p1 TRINITY_DN542_c0_g2~~TRINITY_DN542_c0_g2_i1.p1  ORF type:complete len:298 (-),score=106.14 TRINITY_DN542_c0_g2_i1:3-896(-)